MKKKVLIFGAAIFAGFMATKIPAIHEDFALELEKLIQSDPNHKETWEESASRSDLHISVPYEERANDLHQKYIESLNAMDELPDPQEIVESLPGGERAISLLENNLDALGEGN